VDELDGVYRERNAVVIAFARSAQALGWTVGRLTDEATPGWPVLYIDTPAGQVSWHFPEAEMPDDIGMYWGKWDGHTTAEKYERLSRLSLVA
jgi:hypothetical protein